MTKTINSYTPDGGELTIEITAADFAVLGAAFTQPDTINIDGVVKSFEETSPVSKQIAETFVLGSNSPISTQSVKTSASQWTLVILDDYSKGDTGEWGLDLVTAVEIFKAFFGLSRQISQMDVTPAGGDTGAIQYSLINVDVMSIAAPKTDASTNTPNELSIPLKVESYTEAAHA